MARNHILKHELFTSISKKHNVPSGTVSLSWAVQRGTTVIPKSASKSRIIENMKLIELDEEDMARINDAHKTIEEHRISNSHHLMWVELDGKKTLHGWTEADLGWEDEAGNWLT